MNFVGIIPARYGSSRFPGKPLAMLSGKAVIQRVYEQCRKVLDNVYVATDDQRIYDYVIGFGGEAVITSNNPHSGTDRCYEAYTKLGKTYDVIINIQGDEPFIQVSQINTIEDCFNEEGTQIATLVKPFSPSDSYEALANVNTPKVVVDKDMHAMYFSRSIIPYYRNKDKAEWISNHTYYKHIGMYAYRPDVLRRITLLPQSDLELTESLEQLRWLENGFKIKVGVTQIDTVGIDTPNDLIKAEEYLKNTLHG